MSLAQVFAGTPAVLNTEQVDAIPEQLTFAYSSGTALIAAPAIGSSTITVGAPITAPRSGVYLVSYRLKFSNSDGIGGLSTIVWGGNDTAQVLLDDGSGSNRAVGTLMSVAQASNAESQLFATNVIVMETLTAGQAYQPTIIWSNVSGTMTWNTLSNASAIIVPFC